MPADRARKRCVDHADLPAPRDAQVEVEILGRAQAFVETTDVGMHLAPEHRRHRRQRGIGEHVGQHPAVLRQDRATAEEIDAPALGVDALDVAQDHAEIGMRLKPFNLARGLLRQPFVVAVEQREVAASRHRHAAVACGGDPRVRLAHVHDAVTELGCERLAGAVGGAIVDDDDLLDRPRLREHAADRVRDELAAVPGRYDGGNFRTCRRHARRFRQEGPLW